MPLSVEQLGREEEESDEENDEDGKGKGRSGASFKKFKKVRLRRSAEVLSYREIFLSLAFFNGQPLNSSRCDR